MERSGWAVVATAVAALTLLSGVVPLPSGLHPSAAPPAAIPTGARSSISATTGAASPIAPTGREIPVSEYAAWNRSLSPALVHRFAGEPVSAVPVEPFPSVPPTTPTLVTVTTDLKNCCVRANFTLPVGNWSKIVLTYQGQAITGVSSSAVLYDSSYRMYADQVPILFGTTPEYGTWTVERDVTEYRAILQGPTNLTFLLGAAVIQDYFLSNITLAYYPVSPGEPAPAEPNVVLPVWYSASLTAASPSSYDVVTVPSDVANATLELWAYGFGVDEFWYSTGSPYRAITVASDGTALATEYPFPFINTGGIDLFLWRPVTAVATVDNSPQSFDLTGALPELEGTHNLTLSMSGISASSNWIVDGALLLYTDPNITGATSNSYSGTITPVQTLHSGAVTTETATASFTSNATIDRLRGGDIQVSSTVREMFASNTSIAGSGAWENLSLHTRSVGSVVLSGGVPTTYVNQTFDAPFSVDLGQNLVITRTTNGGFPEYGNFTTSFLSGLQVWNSTTSTTVPSTAGVASLSIVDELAGADGVYGGQEELTSPTAGLILGITTISDSTPREYSQYTVEGELHASYVHLVVGSGTDPPGPYDAATVITDSTSAPLAVGGSISHAFDDVGLPVTLGLTVLGGIGELSYRWSGLPSGCASASSPILNCTPASPGTYSIGAVVTDGTGAQATASVASLLVVGGPSAVVVPSAPGADVGGLLEYNATIRGGFAPYVCRWSVNGTAQPSTSPCQDPFLLPTRDVGNVVVAVAVTDALGATNLSTPVTSIVGTSVAVTLGSSAGNGSSITVAAGSSVLLTASPVGGVPPFVIEWLIGGTASGTGWDHNLTVGKSAGSVTVVAAISDSGGGANQSSTLTVHVSAAPTSSTSPSSASSDLWEYLAFGAFALAAVLAVALLLTLRRTEREPRPKR